MTDEQEITFTSIHTGNHRGTRVSIVSILWTWKEFKAQAEKAGIKDDDVLAWIDWSGPSDFVKVKRRPEGRVQITAGFHYEVDY